MHLFLLGGLAGASSLGDLGSAGILLLGNALLEEGGVCGAVGSGLLEASELGGVAGSLALEGDRGDETLDVGSLLDFLAGLVLEGAGDHVLLEVVLLGEVEELADLVGALGAKALGGGGVGEADDVGISLLLDDKVDHADIGTDDATADRLALALTLAAGTVAGATLLEKETGTAGREDTLLHGETLLVVTAGDAEDVASELVAELLSVHLLGDALVVQAAELLLVIDLDELLVSGDGVCNVKLW